MFKIDSRQIQNGDIYICLPKGEAYIDQAMENGAVEVRHMDRDQLARFAQQHFNHPSQKLKVVGVTGTNGKTTTAHAVAHCINSLGGKAKVSGTLNSSLTTPESIHLQEMMAKHLEDGGTHFVMEVSSHAIDQGRIYGVEFDVKLITNITQDHLDYHGTFEQYRDTKLSFLNKNYGADFIENKKETLVFIREDFIQFAELKDTRLKGEFNHENLKAAGAICEALGFQKDDILKSLKTVEAPPGRFETVPNSANATIIIDFAHTPDGLETILKEAKLLADKSGGRVLTLFGCGGDRDKGKRPLMGGIAERFSDILILTSDNPRSEDESEIINDILTGIQKKDIIKDTTKDTITINPDRKEAIVFLCQKMRQHDVLVLAGKGHEPYQVLKDKTIDFNDKEEVIKWLKENGKLLN